LQRRGGTERSSLQRDETGRVGSTNTGLTVFYRLVSDGKFAEVVTNHLRLNFNSVELLSVVHTNNASDHFGNNNHVSEVSLNCGRLLINLGCFFLRLFKNFSGCPVCVCRGKNYRCAELLEEGHRLPLQATVGKSSARTSMDQINQLLVAEVQKIFEVNATVLELLEGTLLFAFALQNVG